MVIKQHEYNQLKGVKVLYSGDFSKEKTIEFALEQFERHG